MNQAFSLNKLLLILIVSIFMVFICQTLDQKHQNNMQVEPKMILDDFFH